MEMRTCGAAIAAIAATAVALTSVTATSAAVFVGLQQDAGSIVTVDQDLDGHAAFSGDFGTFESVVIFGFGQPFATPASSLLQSTVDTATQSGGTLRVYISSTDNTAPAGLLDLTIGTAVPVLTDGWTASFQSYLDPGNTPYGLTTPLSTSVYDSPSADFNRVTQDAGSGPYSVTMVMTLDAPVSGASSQALIINATPTPPVGVPEPGSVITLLTALAGFAQFGAARRTPAPAS